MLDASSVRIVCRHVVSLANTGGQFMRSHVTSFFIFGLLIHTSAANACEEHHEERYAEWAIESQEERPHAEGPMVPRVDSSEFLVDIDENGAPVGTTRLRLYVNFGTIDPNLYEVALTLYHTGGSQFDELYADLNDQGVVEFALTDIENVFAGEWSGYIQGLDSDSVPGEVSQELYFDPIRHHRVPVEPTDRSAEDAQDSADMTGCETTHGSTRTGLPMVIGMTALFVGLMRRRPSISPKTSR